MDSIIWLIAMVALLILEAGTVMLVSVWFAIGAFAALIASLCGGELWLQLTLFVAVSVVALACLHPLTRKYLKPRIVKTNVDSVVGMQGYITANVDNLNATGTVKLGGMEWTARSTTGETIPAGTLVKVERIEGVKVFVTPVTEKVNS